MSRTLSSAARAVAKCWRSILAKRYAQVRRRSLAAMGECNRKLMVGRAVQRGSSGATRDSA